MSQAWEMTVSYDSLDLRRAAFAVFVHPWRPIYPWALIAALSFFIVVATMFYRDAAYGWVSVTAGFVVVFNLLYWPFVYRAFLRRFARHWNGSAILTIAADGISIDLAGRSARLHWSTIQGVWKDSKSLVLFLSRARAVVIPMADLPDAVREFILERLPHKRSAANG